MSQGQRHTHRDRETERQASKERQRKDRLIERGSWEDRDRRKLAQRP